METYKLIYLNNGDMLFQKNMIGEKNYTISIDAHDNITMTKQEIIKISTYDKFMDFMISRPDAFTNSVIIESNVNNTASPKLKFKPILVSIYNEINDGAAIIRSTKLNIKTIQYESEGFYYLESLGISVQGVDSNKCLHEIITQAVRHQIRFQAKIKTQACGLVCIDL
jgi:hypothetical protein